MNNILVAFVHLLVIVCTTQACFHNNYMRIHIINELPSNSTLKIHCISDGHDLGCSSLNSTQHFSFRVCKSSPILKPDVNCHLIWESSSKELTLKVFAKYGLPLITCRLRYTDCYWSLKAGGLYRSYEGSPLVSSWRPLVSNIDSPCPNGASEDKMEKEHVLAEILLFMCFIAIVIVSIGALFICGIGAYVYYTRNRHPVAARRDGNENSGIGP